MESDRNSLIQTPFPVRKSGRGGLGFKIQIFELALAKGKIVLEYFSARKGHLIGVSLIWGDQDVLFR